jgi:VanW like protein
MTSLSQPKSFERDAGWQVPTRLSGLIFAAKTAALRIKRRAVDCAAPIPCLKSADPVDYPVLLAESRTALWSDTRDSEARHQLGKVENLRQAVRRFDRIAIPAGGVFSFWRQLGRPSRRRGFVDGRMLKEGCLVASTGGGLCQLSNALFDVALNSGAEIVERHAHSRRVAGSAAQFGRDATVAWNYVDFRFKPPQDLILRSILTDQQLVLRLYGKVSRTPADREVERIETTDRAAFVPAARDCGSCRQADCHHHETTAPHVLGRTAFLLDEAWPEFRAYVRERRSRTDLLAIPLDGQRWNRPRYSWETDGYAAVLTATPTALWHAFRARHETANSRRVAAQLLRSKAIAERFARGLAPDVTELCVAQSLLPFLWQMGVLGGRRVTVLMTRLPMSELQARLDAASAGHPNRATLRDFRAPATLIAAEDAALAAAERIVTPHVEVASLFPGRVERLDWQMPAVTPRAAADPRQPRRAIAFPGPSIARKGAHALREAAIALDLEILVLGHDLEGGDFWQGLNVRTVARHDPAWLDAAAVVVQPAFIEEQPRALLAALAAGVPVIASKSCGIPPQPGLITLDTVDAASLIKSLAAFAPQA